MFKVSKRPYRSARHDEIIFRWRHNPTGDDFIYSSGIFFQFLFWPPWRQWRYLQMFSSCQALQYGRLDTLNIKIRPLFQKIQAEPGACNNSGGGSEESDRRSRNTVVLEDMIIWAVQDEERGWNRRNEIYIVNYIVEEITKWPIVLVSYLSLIVMLSQYLIVLVSLCHSVPQSQCPISLVSHCLSVLYLQCPIVLLSVLVSHLCSVPFSQFHIIVRSQCPSFTLFQNLIIVVSHSPSITQSQCLNVLVSHFP